MLLCKVLKTSRYLSVSAAVLIFAVLMSPALQAADVRLTVSDLISDAVLPVLREAAEAQGIALDIRALGSLPAVTEMRNEEIDLTVLAHPITANPLDDTFKVLPLAYELVFVVTHSRNPINDLNLRQLAGIFGSGEELNLTQWIELGVTDLAGRSINPAALSDTRSMAAELFRNSTLAGRQFRSSVNMLAFEQLQTFLAGDPSTIGLSNRNPTHRQLKVISVSQREGTPAFRPNPENAYFEDYPLRLPFVIAFPERARARVMPVINILLGDEVAAALEAAHKIPLPEGARQGLLSDLRSGR
jgi:ABC-type phosphate transport system substrate-binding protein